MIKKLGIVRRLAGWSSLRASGGRNDIFLFLALGGGELLAGGFVPFAAFVADFFVAFGAVVVFAF